MSFGKPQEQLEQVQGFGGGSMRQRASNATRKTGGGGGGKRPYWADTFRPAMQPSVDVIRLLPAELKTQRVDENGQLYEEPTEWKEVIEHYHAGVKRGGLCSAGPFRMYREQRQACHGCDQFWSKPKGERFISMSPKYAMNVLDYAYFHKVPQVDQQTGQYRMNPKTQQPFTEWVKHTEGACTGCTTALETKQGYVYPWMMSQEMFKTLNAYADNVARACRSCGAMPSMQPTDGIHTTSWHCRGCGVCVFDLSNTTATRDQINATVNRPYSCQPCGTVAYLHEVIACSGCQTPVRASIFDVDLQVQAAPTSDKKVALIIPWSSAPQGVHESFAETLKYAPDLDKRFAPMSLEKQAQIWNLTSSAPAAGAQPQQYAQQYGAPPPAQQPATVPAAVPTASGFPGVQGLPQPAAQPAAQPVAQPVATPAGYPPQGGVPPQGTPQQ